MAFWFYFVLSIPASLALVTLTIFLATGLRRLFLPRQKAGIFSRLWRRLLPDVALEPRAGWQPGRAARHLRLDVRPGWLRLMGTKVGRHAEISTAMGIVPDLLTLGDDTFIADSVMLGDEELRGGWMVLRPTGHRQPLVRGQRGLRCRRGGGARRCADRRADADARGTINCGPGQTWMGSPPLLLPARERLEGFPRIADVPAVMGCGKSGRTGGRIAADRAAAGLRDRLGLLHRASRNAGSPKRTTKGGSPVANALAFVGRVLWPRFPSCWWWR